MQQEKDRNTLNDRLGNSRAFL
ncbi:hypothetical protein Atc_0745 [Acidithiobacillus caldus SM-1]|uniref:Uncharacterized protein n=1 Tax=Acidithiobacillus caldus (strain SM-1) TaxID=990288 RepID=F9ZMK5_ACICS|nr:hypothetical protein Atc_0745 [Acidithiobacillus caldus SM-1]